MSQTVSTILVLGVIVVAAIFLTNLYARVAYKRCSSCRALNARRRPHCRICGDKLP